MTNTPNPQANTLVNDPDNPGYYLENEYTKLWQDMGYDFDTVAVEKLAQFITEARIDELEQLKSKRQKYAFVEWTGDNINKNAHKAIPQTVIIKRLKQLKEKL